jgi:hypothetical protein
VLNFVNFAFGLKELIALVASERSRVFHLETRASELEHRQYSTKPQYYTECLYQK